MKNAIIQIRDLTKNYDDQPAVNRLSLTIEKGEIFGLLGPNGAGKSTTILMLLGLIEPTSGSIQICGLDPVRYPLDVKRRVGYLPDNLGFYQNMTGLENLLFTASLNAISKDVAENRAMSLLEMVGLRDAMHKKAGKYSRGMKQRLGLADVLMKEPEVIILDEPTLGIDPEGVRELLAIIKNLNIEKNITVLLSSHNLHQVQQICNRVGIFVKGKLLAKGNLEELQSQLISEDLYEVHVEVDPINKELIQKLNDLGGVNRIKEVSDRKMVIYCQADLTANIASIIVNNGGNLQFLSKKNDGLDEIYHRYFEGRDPHEQME